MTTEILIDETWSKDAPTEVRVGDVVDATGKVLDLQRLIMRRWGWPKLAARRASDAIGRQWAHGDVEGFMLPIAGEARDRLQRKILRETDDLDRDLLEGIANRAHRDVKDAPRPVSVLEVAFVQDTPAGRVPAAIADEGLLTSVVQVVAGRLGIAADDLRERCDFERVGAHVCMTVWVDEP